MPKFDPRAKPPLDGQVYANEAALIAEIQRRLVPRGARLRNMHGNVFQIGVSDLVGVYRGRFVALEAKMPRHVGTARQWEYIEMMRSGGGRAEVVYTVQAALAVLDEIDAEFG